MLRIEEKQRQPAKADQEQNIQTGYDHSSEKRGNAEKAGEKKVKLQ
tara:strand:- start:364 stop:501 length:138 start_codon:yes stop_codon:yes gene_type:complete